jgi:hypothetical protein
VISPPKTHRWNSSACRSQPSACRSQPSALCDLRACARHHLVCSLPCSKSGICVHLCQSVANSVFGCGLPRCDARASVASANEDVREAPWSAERSSALAVKQHWRRRTCLAIAPCATAECRHENASSFAKPTAGQAAPTSAWSCRRCLSAIGPATADPEWCLRRFLDVISGIPRSGPGVAFSSV